MSEERIANLVTIGKLDVALDEALREISRLQQTVERLRTCLQHMHDDKLGNGYTLRHQAWQALNGHPLLNQEDGR